jgi:hypothetical protein
MNKMAGLVRSHSCFGLLLFVTVVGVSQTASAQLSGRYYSVPGSTAVYQYQDDGIQSVALPADLGVTFSGSGSSATLSAIIRKSIIGDLPGNFNFPIVNEFPVEVAGTSTDGVRFHGDLLGTQYLFDWDFTPAVGGQLLWNGSVYWAGGRIELTTITDVHLIPAPPGDYNIDGAVDAADYVLWRKTDGTSPGYEAWREHFGALPGAGTGAALGSPNDGGVPEPGPMALVMLAAVGACFRQFGLRRHGRREN